MMRSIDLTDTLFSAMAVGPRELVMSFDRAVVVEHPSPPASGVSRTCRKVELKIMQPGLTPLLNHLPSAITHGRIVLRDAEYFDAIPLPLVHLGATEFVCRTVDGERIRVTGSGAVVVFLNGEAAPGPVAH